MLIATLCAIAFGYFLFMRIDEDFVFSPSQEGSQSITIKKERIDKVLEYFSLRADRSSQIMNSPAAIIDPSL
jgi:hypothetical protein